MHITLEADYAVRIVGCLVEVGLGRPSGENGSKRLRMDAKTIAEHTHVTLRFALKILRKLVSSGIVKSYKGTQGGYELELLPKDISLCMVIESVGGPYRLSRCLEEDYPCTRNMSGRCCFQKAFGEISAKVREELQSYTFDMFFEKC